MVSKGWSLETPMHACHSFCEARIAPCKFWNYYAYMHSYAEFIKVLRFDSKKIDLVGIMTGNVMGMSRALKVIVLVIIVGVASTGLYLLLTFPKSVVSFPVSFTIGADVERREFSVPILHEWVQVEVVVNSGNLLWTAKILQQDDVLWNHNAHQGDQTTYRSEWVRLQSGDYNFTFATAGIGSLDAEIRVTSKGGSW
jgi:hypothetical protein